MRNSLYVILFFIAAVACSTTHIASGNKQKKRESIKTVLPFEYKNNLIYVKGKLANDTVPYRFMLDSGAPTFMDEFTLKAGDADLYSNEKASDIYGHETAVDVYRLNYFRLGCYSFINLEVISGEQVNEMPQIKTKEISGIVGTNVMKQAIWMIDYKKRKITITNAIDSLNISKQFYKLGFYLNAEGSPVVKLKLADGKETTAIIDIGYNGSVLLQSRFIKPGKTIEDSVTNSSLKVSTGLSSATRQIKEHKLKSLLIGDLLLSGITVQSIGAVRKNLIGNELLKHYVVVLDFLHKELLLIPRMDKEKKDGINDWDIVDENENSCYEEDVNGCS